MPESMDQPEVDPRAPNRGRARDARTGTDAVAARIQHQARWVDLQVQRAMERGAFDNLPGHGLPLGDLGSPYDRDWWLKKLIDREQITGVLPAALQLRKDDAALEGVLDQEVREQAVREKVADFNRRIVEARRQLQGGPPVVTQTRDADTEVERWRERQRKRLRARSGRGTTFEDTPDDPLRDESQRPPSTRRSAPRRSPRRLFRVLERGSDSRGDR